MIYILFIAAFANLITAAFLLIEQKISKLYNSTALFAQLSQFNKKSKSQSFKILDEKDFYVQIYFFLLIA